MLTIHPHTIFFSYPIDCQSCLWRYYFHTQNSSFHWHMGTTCQYSVKVIMDISPCMLCSALSIFTALNFFIMAVQASLFFIVFINWNPVMFSLECMATRIIKVLLYEPSFFLSKEWYFKKKSFWWIDAQYLYNTPEMSPGKGEYHHIDMRLL